MHPYHWAVHACHTLDNVDDPVAVAGLGDTTGAPAGTDEDSWGTSADSVAT